MATLEERRKRSVPPRALMLSLGALAVPVAGAFWTPEAFQEYAALLWLLALIPAFLLAYYRGWRGVATALAAGMATLSLTQVVATWLGRPVPDLLMGIVVAYVAISLGIGWLAELFHREVDEAEDLAFTDLLTRLPNRRHARVFLENEFAAAERGRLLSVVLFDLDGFKKYNDEYGHQAGDEALKAVGSVLQDNTRQMNLSARFGGEEFLAVLAGSDEEGALAFAERIRTEIKDYPLSRGTLTVSAGVASYHPSMRSPDELLAAADHALYRAKSDGRDCVRIFGHTIMETTPAEPDLDASDPGESKEYPRSSDDLGQSPPPVTLLPHQITGFGEGSRILLVEDDAPVRELIASYLEREGFTVVEAREVEEGIRELRTEFDAVITDLGLPGPKGTELVRATRSRWPQTGIIVITGIKDSGVAAEALAAGADRYLYKPFGMSELRKEVMAVLATRNRRREDSEAPPDDDGTDPAARLTVVEGALSLAREAEIRDPYFRGHAERVWKLTRELVEAVDPDAGELPRASLELACKLHDVGRFKIQDRIFQKEGALTDAEWDRVREHPRIGRQILEPVLDDDLVLAVVSWHHERWDGGGYPDGLSGETVPLAARIVAVADALEAMSSSRPHRDALSWEAAVQELRENAGTQFDPGVIDAFETRIDSLARLYPPDDG